MDYGRAGAIRNCGRKFLLLRLLLGEKMQGLAPFPPEAGFHLRQPGDRARCGFSNEAGFQGRSDSSKRLKQDLIIDAVNGGPDSKASAGKESPGKAVEAINQASGIVVSVGVPSGVEAGQ